MLEILIDGMNDTLKSVDDVDDVDDVASKEKINFAMVSKKIGAYCKN